LSVALVTKFPNVPSLSQSSAVLMRLSSLVHILGQKICLILGQESLSTKPLPIILDRVVTFSDFSQDIVILDSFSDLVIF